MSITNNYEIMYIPITVIVDYSVWLGINREVNWRQTLGLPMVKVYVV